MKYFIRINENPNLIFEPDRLKEEDHKNYIETTIKGNAAFSKGLTIHQIELLNEDKKVMIRKLIPKNKELTMTEDLNLHIHWDIYGDESKEIITRYEMIEKN